MRPGGKEPGKTEKDTAMVKVGGIYRASIQKATWRKASRLMKIVRIDGDNAYVRAIDCKGNFHTEGLASDEAGTLVKWNPGNPSCFRIEGYPFSWVPVTLD